MAFLGIKIPEQTGRLLNKIDVPGKKESLSEYHVTILYFGENWSIKEVAKAMEATYEVVADIKPFLIKTNKIGCFPKNDESCPIIARVESDELLDLNEKLRKKFDKEKIEYSKLHKTFKPHITLAYADDEIDEFKINKVECEISELTLWAGDYGNNRLFIDFQLQGPEKQKESAYLMQKATFFCKVAENLPQPHFTSTVDRRNSERK